MKFRYLFAAVGLMLLAAGCDKENPAPSQNGSGTPQIPEGYVALKLSTVPMPKTTFTGASVQWDADDRISVFASGNAANNYEFAVEDAMGSDASFLGYVKPADASAGSFIAAYPYNENITLSGTTLSGLEIRAEQTLKAGTFGQGDNLSVATGGRESVTFRNLCALIRIPVTVSAGVKQIVITAPEGRALAGIGSVDVSASVPAINITEAASNVVTLTAAEPIDATSGVNFYAVVAPQSASATYTVEVILADGSSMTQPLESSTLNRGQFKVAAEMKGLDAAVYYGSANCYIGKPGQDIEFDVTPYYTEVWSTQSLYAPTRTPAFAGKVAIAEVLWTEAGLTLSATYADGKVKVSGITGNGNALVAIKNADGVILWSYHIWVPVADPTKTLTYPMEAAFTTNASYEVMPLALGAINTTGADAAGFFYQWGRKDPLGRTDLTKDDAAYVECGVDWGADLLKRDEILKVQDVFTYSVQNPTRMILTATGQAWLDKSNMCLWGNPAAPGEFSTSYSKSVFDPCPAGYKTSPKELFTRFVKDGGTKTGTGTNKNTAYYNVSNLATATADQGFYFYYNGSDTDFYPFVGYRLGNDVGQIQTNGSGASLWSSARSNSTSNGGAFAMRTAYTMSQIILFNNATTASGYTVRCIKE